MLTKKDYQLYLVDSLMSQIKPSLIEPALRIEVEKRIDLFLENETIDPSLKYYKLDLEVERLQKKFIRANPDLQYITERNPLY